MSMKKSFGARDAMATALLTELNNPTPAGVGAGSLISVYSGTVPASANASVGSSVLLLQIRCTTPHSGTDYNLLFEAPVEGVLVKKAGSIWTGTPLNTATAPTYFRIHRNADVDGAAASTSLPRLQGLVGAGAEAIFALEATGYFSGSTKTIDSMVLTISE